MNKIKFVFFIFLFSCFIVHAEDLRDFESAIQKSQLDKMKALLINKPSLSVYEKEKLVQQAHFQTEKQKNKLDNCYSCKGLKRIFAACLFSIASIKSVFNGSGLYAATQAIVGVSLFKWGRRAQERDSVLKKCYRTQKYENAVIIEQLLKSASEKESQLDFKK